MSEAWGHSSRLKRALLKRARRLNVVLYPELARFETEQERDGALGAVASQYSRSWRYPVTILAVLGCGVALGAIAAEGVQRAVLTSLVPGSLVRAVALLGGLATGIIVLGHLHRNRNRRALRRILTERGVAICIACGYDLTGNVSGRCPECGEMLAPRAEDETGSDDA